MRVWEYSEILQPWTSEIWVHLKILWTCMLTKVLTEVAPPGSRIRISSKFLAMLLVTQWLRGFRNGSCALSLYKMCVLTYSSWKVNIDNIVPVVLFSMCVMHTKKQVSGTPAGSNCWPKLPYLIYSILSYIFNTHRTVKWSESDWEAKG